MAPGLELLILGGHQRGDAVVSHIPRPTSPSHPALLQGAGTDESVLIEIMATRNNQEIAAINEAYQQGTARGEHGEHRGASSNPSRGLVGGGSAAGVQFSAFPPPLSTAYHKRLEDDLSSDTSGHFKRILVSLALVQGVLPLGVVPCVLRGGFGGRGSEKAEHGGTWWGAPPRCPLHGFCIQPQGNRDEGPENLTQAHEDAKVRSFFFIIYYLLLYFAPQTPSVLHPQGSTRC